MILGILIGAIIGIIIGIVICSILFVKAVNSVTSEKSKAVEMQHEWNMETKKLLLRKNEILEEMCEVIKGGKK